MVLVCSYGRRINLCFIVDHSHQLVYGWFHYCVRPSWVTIVFGWSYRLSFIFSFAVQPSWLLSYVSLSDDWDSSIKCTVDDGGEQERVGCVAISPAMKHETITLHRNHLCLLSSFNTCHVGDALFNIRWFGCRTLMSLVLCMNPARCMWLRRSSCVNCLVAGGRGLR